MADRHKSVVRVRSIIGVNHRRKGSTGVAFFKLNGFFFTHFFATVVRFHHCPQSRVADYKRSEKYFTGGERSGAEEPRWMYPPFV